MRMLDVLWSLLNRPCVDSDPFQNNTFEPVSSMMRNTARIFLIGLVTKEGKHNPNSIQQPPARNELEITERQRKQHTQSKARCDGKCDYLNAAFNMSRPMAAAVGSYGDLGETAAWTPGDAGKAPEDKTDRVRGRESYTPSGTSQSPAENARLEGERVVLGLDASLNRSVSMVFLHQQTNEKIMGKSNRPAMRVQTPHLRDNNPTPAPCGGVCRVV
jgi:hypothetical protein